MYADAEVYDEVEGTDEVGNVKLLMERIVALSVAKRWSEAWPEWKLFRIEWCDYGDRQCLCTHNIAEMCWLRNRLNGNEALVGNVCIKRFFDIEDTQLVFDGLRRIVLDDTKAMNPALIEYAYGQGWINDWEQSFLASTKDKRKLSARQRTKREGINRRVIRLSGCPV